MNAATSTKNPYPDSERNPVTSTSVISTSTTVTVAVSEAPQVKFDFTYHAVTKLEITYEGDKLTRLRLLAVDEDNGQADWLETRLDVYEMVQPWIRGEVEKHRPSRQAAAQRAKALQEAYDILARYIPEGAPCDDTECLVDAAGEISEKVQEAERAAVPSMPPKEFLGMFVNIDG